MKFDRSKTCDRHLKLDKIDHRSRSNWSREWVYWYFTRFVMQILPLQGMIYLYLCIDSANIYPEIAQRSLSAKQSGLLPQVDVIVATIIKQYLSIFSYYSVL